MSREDVQLANAVSELQFLHGEPDRILGTVYASSGFRYVDIPDFSLEQSAAWSEVLEARKKTTTPEGKESKTLVQRINGRTLQWGLNWALIKITHPRSVRNVLAKISSSVKMKKNSEVTAYQHLDAYKGYDVAKNRVDKRLDNGQSERHRKPPLPAKRHRIGRAHFVRRRK
jgi:hypothetical protein